MSLYEYAIAVSEEDADKYVDLMFRLLACSGPFSAYRRSEPKIRDEIHTFAETHPKYDEACSICLGRPWTGEGEDEWTDALKANFGLDYRWPVVLDEVVGGTLLPRSNDKQRQWLIANAGKTVILVNDNEY